MAERTYTHSFTVTGRGPFPLDMLRRERCFPSSELDAMYAQHENPDSSPRTVKLERPEGGRWWRPNFGRWESFGWRVLEQGYTDDNGRPVCMNWRGWAA